MLSLSQWRKTTLSVVALLAIAGAGSSRAADICEAVALHDVPSLEDPASVLKKGQRDEAVTQYRVNKKTGLTSLCSHGGYCYPTYVIEDGHKVEALRLTNCKVAARDSFQDPDETFYAVDVIRALIPPKQLAIDDLDNKLLDLGLCSACAGNAAYAYVNKPASPCAGLVRRALAGDAAALEKLKNGSDICN